MTSKKSALALLLAGTLMMGATACGGNKPAESAAHHQAALGG